MEVDVSRYTYPDASSSSSADGQSTRRSDDTTRHTGTRWMISTNGDESNAGAASLRVAPSSLRQPHMCPGTTSVCWRGRSGTSSGHGLKAVLLGQKFGVHATSVTQQRTVRGEERCEGIERSHLRLSIATPRAHLTTTAKEFFTTPIHAAIALCSCPGLSSPPPRFPPRSFIDVSFSFTSWTGEPLSMPAKTSRRCVGMAKPAHRFSSSSILTISARGERVVQGDLRLDESDGGTASVAAETPQIDATTPAITKRMMKLGSVLSDTTPSKRAQKYRRRLSG